MDRAKIWISKIGMVYWPTLSRYLDMSVSRSVNFWKITGNLVLIKTGFFALTIKLNMDMLFTVRFGVYADFLRLTKV